MARTAKDNIKDWSPTKKKIWMLDRRYEALLRDMAERRRQQRESLLGRIISCFSA